MGPLVNSLFVDEAYTDSEEVFNQTITEMNKSKKKGIIMGDKRAVRGKDDRVWWGSYTVCPERARKCISICLMGVVDVHYSVDQIGIVFYNKKEGV